jgi:glucose-1-phosphate thymidylyltransferase
MNTMDINGSEIIGLIPAGGFGKRMRPFKIWKELIPIGYKICLSDEQKIIPKVVAEYTLDNMLHIGTQRIIFVLNEQKTELLRFFGHGNQYETNIAYVCQETNPHFYGMPMAIDTAYVWLKGHLVLMGMPDTIIEPNDCFKRLLEMHHEKKADLTLGVFPTEKPQRLAPVVIQKGTNRVERIYDKPKETKIFNTWNIAVWSTKFTEMLHEFVSSYTRNEQNIGKEMLLTEVFNLAIDNRFAVYGLFFTDGKCYDVGNMDEFIITRHQIETVHLSKLNSMIGKSKTAP